MKNLEQWIWLSKLEKINAKEKVNLLEKYNINQLWNIDKLAASEILDKKEKIDELIDNNIKKSLEQHIEFINKNNIKVLTITDKLYPENLKNIYDPPVVLYVKGNIEALNIFSFAVVGARNATDFGKKIAQEFSYMLAKKNINIVSGLARGIDSNSHIGALKARGITTAIMGTGFDVIYPRENSILFDKIIQNNGVILTEYLDGSKFVPQNFPARNRIISGISDGILVVEASKKSGSLITADFALEQGKNVYVIPRKHSKP